MSSDRTLLIDDLRGFSGVDIIARNYYDGVWELQHHGPWNTLYLDYDFGDTGSYDPERGRNMNGHDVLVWLENHPEHMPEMIVIVSDNPSGREQMNRALKSMAERFRFSPAL